MDERQQKKLNKFISAKPKFLGFALWTTICFGGGSVLLVLISFLFRSFLMGLLGACSFFATYWYLNTIKNRKFVLEEMWLFFFATKHIKSNCFFNREHFTNEQKK